LGDTTDHLFTHYQIRAGSKQTPFTREFMRNVHGPAQNCVRLTRNLPRRRGISLFTHEPASYYRLRIELAEEKRCLKIWRTPSSPGLAALPGIIARLPSLVVEDDLLASTEKKKSWTAAQITNLSQG
jgi:hypothetical protein